MNRFSAPPMIIVLDVLFAVLFVTILETSPNIEIELPKDKLPKNTMVVSLDSSKTITHFFDVKSYKWIKIENMPKLKRRYINYFGDIDCSKTAECRNIKALNKEKKVIYLIDDLADNVAGLITNSCIKFPKKCSNVKYVINHDDLDMKLLLDSYPFFKTIVQ